MSEKVAPKISADTQALIDALKAVLSQRPTLSQRQEDAHREMEELHFPIAPVDKIPTRIPCIHPNGYRFTAVVAPSATIPSGRFVTVEDERWPTDEEMCASSHPTFCDGNGNWWAKRRRFKGNSGEYDRDTQLWLYDNVRLPILRSVGGELPVDWREDMQDKVAAIRAAADEALSEMKAKMASLQGPPAPPENPEASMTPVKKKTA